MDLHDINILFLGGAKRVSMARHFKNAARALGRGCNIFSYEMSLCEAIACEATVIEGLRWSDPGVDDDLRRIIAQHHIDVVVPFVDGAVAVAGRVADVTFVPACSPDMAERMFDKVAAAEIFVSLGVPVPPTYTAGEPSLHLIAKPRHGSASKGIVEIHSLEQLDHILGRAGEYLIQERIDNRAEYTVDCYASVVDGRLLAACPRLRQQVSGGEVIKTVTVARADVAELAASVIKSTGLRGAITVQVIEDLDDGRIMVMEINPRLGGGAVCSVAAGADIPRLILSEALGLKPERPEWKAGVAIARYPAEVVFYPD